MQPLPKDQIRMSRILLVTSDLSLCSTISGTLSALGYPLDVAYDAAQARSLAAGRRYDIGLIGERLSDCDGVSLFTELHERSPVMSGVLVAAAANLYTVVKAVGAGMARVVARPLDFKELLEVISAQQTMQNREGDMDVDVATAESLEQSIADLSTDEIDHRLTDGELIEIIRQVDYPFAGKERLEHFDRDTLQRVVHLIRRWCRNRLEYSSY